MITIALFLASFNAHGDAVAVAPNAWVPTYIARRFHGALALMYGEPLPGHGWTVTMRYDGYGIGTLRWCAERARYIVALCDRRNGVFAVDGHDDTTAAFVLMLEGTVKAVFDAHGGVLASNNNSLRNNKNNNNGNESSVPFYRDAAF